MSTSHILLNAKHWNMNKQEEYWQWRFVENEKRKYVKAPLHREAKLLSQGTWRGGPTCGSTCGPVMDWRTVQVVHSPCLMTYLSSPSNEWMVNTKWDIWSYCQPYDNVFLSVFSFSVSLAVASNTTTQSQRYAAAFFKNHAEKSTRKWLGKHEEESPIGHGCICLFYGVCVWWSAHFCGVARGRAANLGPNNFPEMNMLQLMEGAGSGRAEWWAMVLRRAKIRKLGMIITIWRLRGLSERERVGSLGSVHRDIQQSEADWGEECVSARNRDIEYQNDIIKL